MYFYISQLIGRPSIAVRANHWACNRRHGIGTHHWQRGLIQRPPGLFLKTWEPVFEAETEKATESETDGALWPEWTEQLI